MTKPGYQPVLRLCSSCSSCPELHVDDAAPVERQVRITDDFGQKVEMSKESLRVLLDASKNGTLSL